MTSKVKADITLSSSQYEAVCFLPGSRRDSKLPPNADHIFLKQYRPDFLGLAGPGTVHSLLISSDDSSRNPLFYNGCVYLPKQDQLFVTSDFLQTTNSSTLPTILISKLDVQRLSGPEQHICAFEWMKLRPPLNMPMPAGACQYKDGVLYCSQGTLTPDSGGLWYMALGKAPTPVLTSYFNKPFNSIQSVVEDMTGSLWFTDASVGFEQEIRPKPQLPNQVYRFDPKTGDLRVVADGFSRPMGIAFSPDNSTLYVTDTDAARPDGSIDPTRAATIYAFDVTHKFGSPVLVNRHVFAYVRDGVPAAVACDKVGNVYAACADGVEVWSPGGVALGLIEVPGGCTSLCFGRDGELFICAKQRLWMVRLERT
ncbi:calcium-dependent phosphotriesterase [Hypoxylon crocopeplum]|nr:calcium-dependent phosphotriesterase [Hypoxylon crocopeplum]